MTTIVLNNREYEVEERENETYLKDLSNRKIKVHLSFSKDENDNQMFKEGMKTFWTEVFS